MNISRRTLLLGAPLLLADRPRKVVLIAGVKSHGPGAHEYLKTVKLLKVLLDRAMPAGSVQTEVHFNGWPDDAHTLEDADTIFVMSDGQPGLKQPPMPIMTEERMPVLRRQMQRGCGIVLLHYSTFLTHQFAAEMLDWVGGYFEWTGPNGYVSAIKTLETPLTLASPKHPVVQGMVPFTFRDEYYFKLRLNDKVPGFAPILQVPVLAPLPSDQTVAWAFERVNHGRGFGTTTGHFFENWKNDHYRKLILNAIVWTAGATVPVTGIESRFIAEQDVNAALLTKPLDALLILADGTRADSIREVLDREIPRFRITLLGPADILLLRQLSKYKLIILDQDMLRRVPAIQRYVESGGGVAILHPGEVGTAQQTVTIRQHAITRNITSFPVKVSPSSLTASDAAVVPAAIDDQAVTIARQAGRGRIFETTLAYDQSSLDIAQTAQLVLYGSLWAAGE